MAFEQEAYIGDSELSLVSAPTNIPNALAYKRDGVVGSFEGSLRGRNSVGASAREEMVKAPALMDVAGANASLSVSGGRMNEAEPQSIDAPNRVAITPGSLREPSFSPSWEATLDDVLSVTRSFDIVDLGNRELELLGYPQAPLLPTS
jgi:hypothetical protein